MELCIIDKLPFQQTSFRIKRTALKCPNRGFVSFKGQNLPSAVVLKMLLPCMLQSNQIRMALLVVRNRIWKTFACYLLQHVNDPNDDVDFTRANTVSNIQKLFERFETTVCISWKQGNIENRLPFQADVEPLKSSRFPLCPYAHQPAAFRESHNCRNISVCSVWTVTWLAVGSEVRHLCPSKQASWFQRKSIHLFFTSRQNERAFQGCVPEWSGGCVTCSK